MRGLVRDGGVNTIREELRGEMSKKYPVEDIEPIGSKVRTADPSFPFDMNQKFDRIRLEARRFLL